jgi:hypothetical protein
LFLFSPGVFWKRAFCTDFVLKKAHRAPDCEANQTYDFEGEKRYWIYLDIQTLQQQQEQQQSFI